MKGSRHLSTTKLPGLFTSADKAASSAETSFVAFAVADLAILTLAAIISAVSPLSSKSTEHPFDIAALASSLLLVAGLVVAIASRTAQFNKRWFSARAIAESVKTETWRFMMRCPPHDPLGPGSEAAFKAKLKQIFDSQPDAHSEMAKHNSAEAWISSEMSTTRALGVAERFARYQSERFRDQRNWYSDKAQASRKEEGRWFVFGIVTHGVAVGLSIVSTLGFISLNWIGVLTTVSASFVAWTQLRDHQRLANSYALIAQELAMLEPSTDPATDDDLSKFVEEVERTISREHTLWISRKL